MKAERIRQRRRQNSSGKSNGFKTSEKGHSIEDIAECVDFDEETVKNGL